MRIRSMSLHNFRNFTHVDEIEFPSDSLLVAVAPNASGKTNFLESIVVLLKGKSFRGNSEECVRWCEDTFLVRGSVDSGSEKSQIAVQYHAPSRKIRIEEDGSPASPVSFYSRYPFILFLPEDTFLFTRGPAARRNFLNNSIVSNSQYLSSVVQYHRILRQRNAALKDATSEEQVSVWSELLARHAEGVWVHRKAFVEYLQSKVSTLYSDLFGEDLDFLIEFTPGVSDMDNYSDLMRESWEYERKYKHTLYGPHRDDVHVSVGGRPISAVLSRGQMRSFVIACKVATYGFVKQVLGREPVLLLDEVLSELDVGRQRVLLEHLTASQTLLTCTSIPKEVRDKSGVHMLDLRSIVESSSRTYSMKESSSVSVSSQEREELVSAHSS